MRTYKIARISGFSFVTDAAGTRIAAGAGTPSCLRCSGPVTILDAGVQILGATWTADNQIVFARLYSAGLYSVTPEHRLHDAAPR